MRHHPRAPGQHLVPAHDSARSTDAGRLFAARLATAARQFRPGVHLVSATIGTPRPAVPDAERRRTPDGCDRNRPDGRPATADARRAHSRAGAKGAGGPRTTDTDDCGKWGQHDYRRPGRRAAVRPVPAPLFDRAGAGVFRGGRSRRGAAPGSTAPLFRNGLRMSAIIVSGLVSGSLYALMASGLSLVWGALGVFNFAHGVLLMMAAYAAWWVSSSSGLGAGLAAGVVAAVVFSALAGALLYWVLVRPWLGKPDAELSVIMTTIAGAIFLENLVLEVFGGHYKELDQVVTGTVMLAGTTVQAQDLMAIFLAPALLGGVAALLTRSRTGLAVRAIAQNRDAARLLGINIERIYLVTFAVSAVLAGIAGITIAGLFSISPAMGNDPLLRAFVVVVFGGLGSLIGTIAGAYVIGMVEAVSSYYIGIYWTPVVLFLVLIAVLTVRPTGLMGRAP